MEESQDTININFRVLFRLIMGNKFLLLIITSLITTLGAFYALSLKNEFVSQGKILPEYQGKSSSSGLGNLASIANLAGVDLGSTGSSIDAIRPDLYPNVLQSTPFFLELLKQKVKTKAGKEITVEQFYANEILGKEIKKEDKTLSVPEQKDKYISLSNYTAQTIKELKSRVSAALDKKTGIITISVKTPDPVISASIAKYGMDYLTSYITNYRTEKARKEFEDLNDQVQRAKGKFYTNQERKAKYSDNFQLGTIKLQSADVQRNRIEVEYDLSSDFYKGLLRKLEEARLKIQQETPVFNVLEPPVVPNFKSEPARSIILIMWFIAGLGIGLITLLIIKKNYQKVFYRNK